MDAGTERFCLKANKGFLTKDQHLDRYHSGDLEELGKCEALWDIYQKAERIKDSGHYESRLDGPGKWKKGIGLVQNQIEKYFDKRK